MARRERLSTAAGPWEFLALDEPVRARVLAENREGPETEFSVLISDQDDEVLVSDAGIDALGVRIESFRPPGRWRFSDEQEIRTGESPQPW